MNYEGKLYAKIGDKYIEMKHSAKDVEELIKTLASIANIHPETHEDAVDAVRYAKSTLNFWNKKRGE